MHNFVSHLTSLSFHAFSISRRFVRNLPRLHYFRLDSRCPVDLQAPVCRSSSGWSRPARRPSGRSTRAWAASRRASRASPSSAYQVITGIHIRNPCIDLKYYRPPGSIVGIFLKASATIEQRGFFMAPCGRWEIFSKRVTEAVSNERERIFYEHAGKDFLLPRGRETYQEFFISIVWCTYIL